MRILGASAVTAGFLVLTACAETDPYTSGFTAGCRVGEAYSGATFPSLAADDNRGTGEHARGYDDGVQRCYGSPQAYARAARGPGR
jgi:hypothetical protein